MVFNHDWVEKPQEGYEFIYRYYDDTGKSYIGHTKQSLCLRAGGKKGTNYTRVPSKFQEAIIKKGFDAFEFEILEEVPEEQADDKEKYYVCKFDSKQNGYNSTYGGRIYYADMNNRYYDIDLKTYNVEQLRNLSKNISVFCRLKINEANNIDYVIKQAEDIIFSHYYTYYAFEGKYINKQCHPIVNVFNFVDLLISKSFDTYNQILNEMYSHECLGGDLLTCGDYNVLRIKLLNNEIVSYDF